MQAAFVRLVCSVTLSLCAVCLIGWALGGSLDSRPVHAAPGLTAVFIVMTTTDFSDDNPGDGVCFDSRTGLCTLRGAVVEANALYSNAGGEYGIVLPAGTYVLGGLGQGDTQGDLDVRSRLIITGSGPGTTFIQSIGQDRAFEVYAQAHLSMSGVTIRQSRAALGGGILVNLSGTLSLRNCFILNNESSGNGGGIYSSGEVTVSGCMVWQNKAGGDGGGIYSQFGTLHADGNSSFLGNVLTTAGKNGGGIASLTATLDISNVTFTQNTATGDGGAIYSRFADGNIRHATITSNDAGGNGGGIMRTGAGGLGVSDSTINSNDAGGNGGGAAGVSLTRVEVRQNHADGDGGGLSSANSVSASTVSQNTAGGNGGGLTTGGSSVASSTITGNQALQFGGGIYATGGLTLKASTVSSNSVTSANAHGGGLMLSGINNFSTIDSEIFGNSANAGAGIFLKGTLTLSRTLVADNHAIDHGSDPASGGGIFNSNTADNDVLILQESILHANISDDYGGGIYNYPEDTFDGIDAGMVRLQNSILYENAAGYGGGVYNEGVLTVTASTLYYNGGGLDGGGIWNSDLVSMTNSTLSANNAGRDGGGFFNAAAGTVRVAHSTLTLNQADTDGNGFGNGGGFHNNGGTVSVKSTIIGNNHDLTGVGVHRFDCSGGMTSQGYNIIGDDGGCTYTATTGDQVNVAPLLGALAYNGGPTPTHNPTAGSPAIDSGSNTVCPPADQRGIARPLDGPDGNSTATCDIGAVEFIAFDVAVSKQAGSSLIEMGSLLTYTVRVTNTGGSAVTAVRVTDTLPPFSTFKSASGAGWSCSGAGPVVCTAGALAAGAVATFNLVITGPNGLIVGGIFSNVVTANASPGDQIAANSIYTEPVGVNVPADMQVSVAPNALLVHPGGLLSYTIIISGHSTAWGAVMTDAVALNAGIVEAYPTPRCSFLFVTHIVTCDTVSFAVRTYTVVITAPLALGPFSNTAYFLPPKFVTELAPADNIATAVVTVTNAPILDKLLNLPMISR